MAHFNNSDISSMTTDEIAKHVASSQTSIASAMETYRKKTRREHAVLMLKGRAFIKTMEQSVKLDDQAAMLTRHQIKAAGAGISSYTPWIKLLFGKHDPENKKVKFGDEEHVKWVPDTSYARYFNFYEVIDRDFKGPEDELLDWVIAKGGPSVIVEDELERKRQADMPSDEAIEARTKLFLEEADMPPVSLPAEAIASKEEYVGVILRNTGDGYCLVGINKENAKADFERIAAKHFDALTQIKAGREAEAEAAEKLAEAEKRAENAAAERIAAAMGLSIEAMREKMAAHQQSLEQKVG